MLSLATTRLISHHISGGKSILASLSDRFDYGQNLEKTLDGSLIRSYECDPLTADSEFLLSKARYKSITGREQKRDADVLCYQIRQSFPPGELDPEEALNIGYELAMRWIKGKHAFFVVSHADRPAGLADFLKRMEAAGVQVKWGQGGVISFRFPGQDRATRFWASTLGDG